MANIFEIPSKYGNITHEKARKTQQMQFRDKTAYVLGLRYRWDLTVFCLPEVGRSQYCLLIIFGSLWGPWTHFLVRPFHPRSLNKFVDELKQSIKLITQCLGPFCLGKDSMWRRPFWWCTFIPFLGPVGQLYQSSYSMLRLKYGHFTFLFQTKEGGRQNNSTWAIEEACTL